MESKSRSVLPFSMSSVSGSESLVTVSFLGLNAQSISGGGGGGMKLFYGR